ncbi:MAG: rhodanese-like domain-containing protein [Pseudomonadota bacterium]
MRECSPADAAAALERGDWTLVDVREPEELSLVSIDGAMNVPLSEITERYVEIPTDRPIALMCHHGGRSAQALAYLATHGITDTMNVVGGIDRWALTVDESLNRY